MKFTKYSAMRLRSMHMLTAAMVNTGGALAVAMISQAEQAQALDSTACISAPA